jgi:hypothetical protein
MSYPEFDLEIVFEVWRMDPQDTDDILLVGSFSLEGEAMDYTSERNEQASKYTYFIKKCTY